MNRLPFAVAGLILLIDAAASAGMRQRRTASVPNAQADSFYQTGVDQYAEGRFPQALAAFQEAVRRDPRNHAARIAVSRVHEEIAMAVSEKSPSASSQLSASQTLAKTEVNDSFLSSIAPYFAIEQTVGDERDHEGQILAMQGRIAQLLIEKKVVGKVRF